MLLYTNLTKKKTMQRKRGRRQLVNFVSVYFFRNLIQNLSEGVVWLVLREYEVSFGS